nr:MAG TPA: hypothetical protein [Caudoviricetes sp.]
MDKDLPCPYLISSYFNHNRPSLSSLRCKPIFIYQQGAFKWALINYWISVGSTGNYYYNNT